MESKISLNPDIWGELISYDKRKYDLEQDDAVAEIEYSVELIDWDSFPKLKIDVLSINITGVWLQSKDRSPEKYEQKEILIPNMGISGWDIEVNLDGINPYHTIVPENIEIDVVNNAININF